MNLSVGLNSEEKEGEILAKDHLEGLVEALRRTLGVRNGELSLLMRMATSESLAKLMEIHRCVVEFSNTAECAPAMNKAYDLAGDVYEEFRHYGTATPQTKELLHIMSKPHVRALFDVHDRVAAKEYLPGLPVLSPEEEKLDQGETTPVKIARLIRQKEPLGVTLRSDNLGCVFVARILKNGPADKSGLVTIGDQLLEVNGFQCKGHSTEEVARMFDTSHATICMKLIPASSARKSQGGSKMYLKAHFTFDPRDDPSIPCVEAGLPFRKGDILEVLRRDDAQWWQAVVARCNNPKTGLIPSRLHRERRLLREQHVSGSVPGSPVMRLKAPPGGGSPIHYRALTLQHKHNHASLRMHSSSSHQVSTAANHDHTNCHACAGSPANFANDLTSRLRYFPPGGGSNFQTIGHSPLTSATIGHSPLSSAMDSPGSAAGLLSSALSSAPSSPMFRNRAALPIMAGTLLSPRLYRKMRKGRRFDNSAAAMEDKHNCWSTEDLRVEDFQGYEEVALYETPASRPRPVILIGPSGIGREELTLKMRSQFPSRFKTPIPYTTRPKKLLESEGKEFHFISRADMEKDIQKDKYIDFVEYKGHLYGTKLSSLLDVMKSEKCCLLDVQPQALKGLWKPELKPFVIFIKPPTADKLKKSRSILGRKGSKKFTEPEVNDILLCAARMEALFWQYLHTTVVIEDFNQAFKAVMASLDSVFTEPQFVPTCWVNRRG